MFKKCSKCKIEKEESCFYKNKNLILSCQCKQCHNERGKKRRALPDYKEYVINYRKEHKEHLLELSRRSANKEENKIKKHAREKQRRLSAVEIHREKNRNYYRTPNGRYVECRRRAKRSKLEFTLTFEQFMFFWQKNCFYCNDKIEYIGIDRYDNTKGYIIDNCIPCCARCNRMKLDMDWADWIAHMKKIIETQEMEDRKCCHLTNIDY